MRAKFRNRRGRCLPHGWFGSEQVDEDVAMQALASILPSNRSSVMAAKQAKKASRRPPAPKFQYEEFNHPRCYRYRFSPVDPVLCSTGSCYAASLN
jgi:hypothetical protein